MIAVIMTASTFIVTAFVWQQPQQTQALMRSESSSLSCVENQPCHTAVTNSSTSHSKLTSSPYSASSSKLVPSPASIFAPQSFLPNSFLPDTSSAHPSSAHPSEILNLLKRLVEKEMALKEALTCVDKNILEKLIQSGLVILYLDNKIAISYMGQQIIIYNQLRRQT